MLVMAEAFLQIVLMCSLPGVVIELAAFELVLGRARIGKQWHGLVRPNAMAGQLGAPASDPVAIVAHADQIGLRFRMATKRLGLNERNSKLRIDLFQRPVAKGQQIPLL